MIENRIENKIVCLALLLTSMSRAAEEPKKDQSTQDVLRFVHSRYPKQLKNAGCQVGYPGEATVDLTGHAKTVAESIILEAERKQKLAKLKKREQDQLNRAFAESLLSEDARKDKEAGRYTLQALKSVLVDLQSTKRDALDPQVEALAYKAKAVENSLEMDMGYNEAKERDPVIKEFDTWINEKRGERALTKQELAEKMRALLDKERKSLEDFEEEFSREEFSRKN